MRAIVAAWVLVAVGCGSPPASSPTVSVATAVATGEPMPTSTPGPRDGHGDTAPQRLSLPKLDAEADLDVWMQAPCIGFSKQTRELACIEAKLDMGFVDARFVTISIDERRETRSLPIYSGPSAVDPKKVDTAAVTQAQEVLDAGAFTPGRAIGEEKVVRTPDGYFRIELPTGNMTGKLPAFASTDGPEGFAGDLSKCMQWEHGDARGQVFAFVTALRIHTSHTFTMDQGQPCSHDAELNDETFPAQFRWLILYAK